MRREDALAKAAAAREEKRQIIELRQDLAALRVRIATLEGRNRELQAQLRSKHKPHEDEYKRLTELVRAKDEEIQNQQATILRLQATADAFREALGVAGAARAAAGPSPSKGRS